MVVVQFDTGVRVVALKRRISASSISGNSRPDFEALFQAKLDNIRAELESLFRSAYDMGSSQAAGRFLEFVNANDSTINLPKITKQKGGRVPRGSTRKFVQQVLGSEPVTVREIRDSAQTDDEKAISYQTIRLELLRGRKEKLYKKTIDKDGTDRWHA